VGVDFLCGKFVWKKNARIAEERNIVEEVNMSEQATAYHEAGHSGAACLVHMRFRRLTIVPEGDYRGVCLLKL